MASDGRISFTPSEQVKAYLAEIKRMGIYGKKRGDVINFMLGKEIMRLVEEKVIQRLDPAQESAMTTDDDDED